LTVDDAAAAHALIADAELHDQGEVLVELADIVSDWQRPSFDLLRDSVAILDADGGLAAVGEVYRGQRAEIYVHPLHRGRGLGSALMRWSWSVARAAGAEQVGQTVPDSATDAVKLFQANGYRSAHTSWILELPDDAEITAQPWPDGVALRAFEPGRDEHATYRVIEDAFNEWPGRQPVAFEDWAARTLGRPGFQPWHITIAESDTSVVGACVLQLADGVGWIDQVAVAASARGRGIAAALLAAAFRTTREQGFRRLELSTDSRTGALGLYERVGMRIRSQYTHWALPLT
jgi:mycothiol synthase